MCGLCRAHAGITLAPAAVTLAMYSYLLEASVLYTIMHEPEQTILQVFLFGVECFHYQTTSLEAPGVAAAFVIPPICVVLILAGVLGDENSKSKAN